MAAIVGTRDIMSHFDKSIVGESGFTFQIGTLSGNPLAAAAGLKTLEILRRENSYTRLKVIGERLMKAASASLSDHNIAHRIVGEPMLFDVLFTDRAVSNYRDTLEADSAMSAQFNNKLRALGIFKSPGKLYPSLALSEEDIQATETALKTAADQLQHNG